MNVSRMTSGVSRSPRPHIPEVLPRLGGGEGTRSAQLVVKDLLEQIFYRELKIKDDKTHHVYSEAVSQEVPIRVGLVTEPIESVQKCPCLGVPLGWFGSREDLTRPAG